MFRNKNLLKILAVTIIVSIAFSGCSREMRKLQRSVSEMTMSSDEKALISAVNNNKLEKVKKLLDNGTNPNTKDKWNNTAMEIAIKNGNVDIAKLLVKKGAKLELKKLIDRARDKDSIAYLISQGAFINDFSLHSAVRVYKDKVYVKALVDNGADIYQLDYNYKKPIDYAKNLKDKSILKYLLSIDPEEVIKYKAEQKAEKVRIAKAKKIAEAQKIAKKIAKAKADKIAKIREEEQKRKNINKPKLCKKLNGSWQGTYCHFYDIHNERKYKKILDGTWNDYLKKVKADKIAKAKADKIARVKAKKEAEERKIAREKAKAQRIIKEKAIRKQWIKRVGQKNADKITKKYPNINGQEYCSSTNDFICNILNTIKNTDEMLVMRFGSCKMLLDATHFSNFGNLMKSNSSDLPKVCRNVYYNFQKENRQKYGTLETTNKDHIKMQKLVVLYSRYKY